MWSKLIETREIAQAKMEVCKQCEFYREKRKLCAKCGCIMPVKVQIKGNNCPIKKHNKDNLGL